MEQILIETKWDVGTSLIYPGQCYSGFSTSITAFNLDKCLRFVLRDESSPQFKCPEIMLKFRQIEKWGLFKKKLVWVADIQLTNCHSINCESFVGTVEVFKSKYKTNLVIKPDDKKNRLFTIHRKWAMEIEFNYASQIKGEEIAMFIASNFGVHLITKNKK